MTNKPNNTIPTNDEIEEAEAQYLKAKTGWDQIINRYPVCWVALREDNAAAAGFALNNTDAKAMRIRGDIFFAFGPRGQGAMKPDEQEAYPEFGSPGIGKTNKGNQ